MPAAGGRDRSRIVSGRRWTRRSRQTGRRSAREDLATEPEVLAVPTVADPHDRDATGGAARVQRVPLADVRVDVVDGAVAVAVVEHQVPRSEVAEPDPLRRHGRYVGRG